MTCASDAWAKWARPNLQLHIFIVLLLLYYCKSSNPVLEFLYGGKYNASIFENCRPRTYVSNEKLMGIPLEGLPPEAHVSFQILEGDKDGFFTVETENIGGIAVMHLRTRTGMRDVLNRERKALFRLKVEAAFYGPGGIKLNIPTVKTAINVNVLDINDNIPLFYTTAYNTSIDDSSSIHTNFITLIAHDADEGYNGQVYYSLENTHSDQFAIHPTSGSLSLTRPLQQHMNSLSVVILAQDRGGKLPGLRTGSKARATVEVNVNHLNDYDPEIKFQRFSSVMENSFTNIYALITVNDKDSGLSGDIKSLKIVKGNLDKIFRIAQGSTENEYKLILLKPLDHKIAPNGYNLTIEASDKGIPSRVGNNVLFVNIRDVNDDTHMFSHDQYNVNVSEEAPPYTALTKLSVSDSDKNISSKMFYYIVSGNENGFFSLDSHTAVLSTTQWLDRESTASYILNISAINKGSRTHRKESTTKVSLNVVDINDNTPIFNTPTTEITIDENIPNGSYVTQITAKDNDNGENGFISYSITNVDDVPFSIDPFDGALRTSRIIDYESDQHTFVVIIRASDWGTPFKREAEIIVRVRIRDINDNRPQFEGVDCHGWVSINSPPGTSIITMSALDLDSNSIVTYRLDDTNDCWSIDSVSGIVTLTCNLNRKINEQKVLESTFSLNVRANDGMHSSDPTKITLEIITKQGTERSDKYAHVVCKETNIRTKASEVFELALQLENDVESTYLSELKDENLHAPLLPNNFPNILQVKEDASVGTQLLIIEALDPDQGFDGKVVYSISGDKVNSKFKIGIQSGILEVWGELDREERDNYSLNITVYDLGNPHKYNSHSLIIYVLDVNDNPPQFTQEVYKLHLPENTHNDTTIAQITAIDIDIGINAQISYELVSRIPNFKIDSKTGILSLIGGLDRENQEEYTLKVLAKDSGKNPLSTITNIHITILDINDCSPDFSSTSVISTSIPEDLPIGTVVATFIATDKDSGLGGKVTYSIEKNIRNIPFRIDSQTGIVRISDILDYETQESYNIIIKAKDGGRPSLNSFATLLVSILDVDENRRSPKFAKHLLHVQVRENQSPGELVNKMSIEDSDSSLLSFAIIDGNGIGYFTIDDEGHVRTRRVLDCELEKGYWLTIAVTDTGSSNSRIDYCHVYVEVSDVNDHVPQSRQPTYQAFIAEDAVPGDRVTKLQAIDGDVSGRRLSFTISHGNRGNEFSIGSTSGIIRVASQLDREQCSEHKLKVTISDGELTSDTHVIITITDVNDHTPKFTESLYRISVPARDASKNKEDLFRVFALDGDEGPNALLEYNIESSHGKRFKINTKTGHVLTNREMTPGETFDITISVADSGNPALGSSTHVLLRVAATPINSSHPPTIDALLPVHIMESDKPGTLVTFIQAYDLDNDSLWYYITGGDNSGRFCIGVDSGVIWLARPVDHEDQYQYNIEISVTDGVYTVKEKLMISVVDTNDHRPVLSRSSYKGRISESASVGTTVLTAQCRDNDSSNKKSPVYFSVHHYDAVHSEDIFTINSETGDITLAKPLDREIAGEHQFTISCRDRGNQENHDFARVTIAVTDDNDHDPVFLENEIIAKVRKGAAIGSLVTRVIAFDQDLGDSGRLSYALNEGNVVEMFEIDKNLGTIRLKKEIQSDGPHEYDLEIIAQDHGKQPKSSSISVKIIVNSDPDDPPTWIDEMQPQSIEISEWLGVGSVVTRVTANAMASISYAITSGNELGKFRVSGSSGIVSLAGTVDREDIDWYNLTITATNAEGVSSSRWLGVGILDENDCRPEWDSIENVGSVASQAEIGSAVLHMYSFYGHPVPLTVKAIDLDTAGNNGHISYSILEPNATQYFSISQHTGAVRVSGPLTDIAGQSVIFHIWAADGGNPVKECQIPAAVNITVIKEDKIVLSFPKSKNEAKLYLPTVPGISVICVLLPNKTEHDITYQLLGDETNSFIFEKLDGCIYVHSSQELNRFYNLTLEAAIQDITANTNVNIQVLNPPLTSHVFTQEKYYASVMENSTREIFVETISILDIPLNHHINYSILNPIDSFDIVPSVGTIKTTGIPLDRERKDQHSLLIKAVELEDPSNFAFVTVEITIKDINDNAPMFVNQPYQALVAAGAKPGTVFAKVSAIDIDSEEFGSLIYKLIDKKNRFGINENTGEIFSKKSLSTIGKTINLGVEVFDGGIPPLKAQTTVQIRVVSGEGPMFTSMSYSGSVSENVPRGTPVARVQAHSPSNSPLIYTLIKGNTQENFALDYKTGVIHTASDLDYEKQAGHNLTIRASDPLSGLYIDAIVHVTVQDVNDNAPKIGQSIIQTQVSEASYSGYKIFQVAASDPDEGLSGAVRYRCTSNCNTFAINSETGWITLKSSVDAEELDLHIMGVEAYDLGLPSKVSAASVHIKILDINDNPPTWPLHQYDCQVSPIASQGHIITALRAHDADITQLKPLQYRIHSGDPNNIFTMDTISGVVRVVNPQKLQQMTSMYLNISASDDVHISFTQLQVSLISGNLHAPRFHLPVFEGQVEENLEAGALVLTLSAEDLDDKNADLHFEIIFQSQDEAFTINQEGELYTALSLDREELALHIIHVSVMDEGGKSDFAKVRITIKDENDNAPKFILSEYQGNIPVNMVEGTNILQVTATDADDGINSHIVYEIYESTSSEVIKLFTIDPSSGIISLADNPRGRENEFFQFFIHAEDRGSPNLSNDVPVSIFLLPADEQPPSCPLPNQQFFMKEDAPLGSVITNLWSSGPQKVEYSIITESQSNENPQESMLEQRNSRYFTISRTGDIALQLPVDREASREHQIVIGNQTNSNPPIIDYMTISVIVMDINDSPPVFSSSSYEILVAENNDIGSTITVFTATDNDEGKNGKVFYSIEESEDYEIISIFQVNKETGALILTLALDREIRSIYTFTINATDNGTPSLTAHAEVNIIVKDFNDNPPYFTQKNYESSVSEGIMVGKKILQVETTDADEKLETLVYFVTSGDPSGHFMVDNSGYVSVAKPLDREKQEHFEFTVAATDGSFTANTSVAITVTDVNDNGPKCKKSIYEHEISEGSTVGMYILTIESSDADVGVAGQSRYQLSGSGASKFIIDQINGQLSTAILLDREEQDFYELTIVVEDWEHPEWQCQVTVILHISDINDNAPQFSSKNYSTIVPEDALTNSVIFKVSAIDPDIGDSNRVRYGLIDSEDGHFSIDHTQGIINLAKPLDRETKDTYVIKIQAADQGMPPMTSLALLNITISDINDNAPEFLQSIQETIIPENTEIGTEVMRVLATSRDIGINAEISYSMDHTTTDSFLEIHSKTGIITVSDVIDYEKMHQIICTIIATDGGTPPLSSTAIANITITDINDNAPVFSESSYIISVQEDADINHRILHLTANDIDTGLNGEVTYAILPNELYLPFQIDRNSGVLSLDHVLDREKVTKYVVEVEARDKGTPSNSQVTRVIIQVKDVNDNPPMFVLTNASLIVQENRPVGYSVTRLKVTDRDTEMNGPPFTWEIINQVAINRAFTIRQDGTIRLATNKLNYIHQSEYAIQVRVWDNGSPPLQSTTHVVVNIVEESRFPPTVFPLSVSVISYGTLYPGGLIGQVMALDQDPYDTLHYSITPTAEINRSLKMFDIDSQDGNLVALFPLDAGEYEVNVTVSDGLFKSLVTASVSVILITEAMLRSSVVVRIGPLSPTEFISHYQKIFTRALVIELSIKESSLQILSIQSSIQSQSLVSEEKFTRKKRDVQRSLDILFVVKDMNEFLNKDELINNLVMKQSEIKSRMNIPQFIVLDSVCNSTVNCNGNGSCHDIVEMSNNLPLPIKTKTTSIVAPKFRQVASCQCYQGLGGSRCETLVNACGYRPCAEFQECTPTESNPRGYTCQCPVGHAGPKCEINLAKCQLPDCHYPLRPLSFKGNSYAQYSVPQQVQSSSLSLTLYLRTRYPVGYIMYSSGKIDYSILEVTNGFVQYRWDCGSGEGIVKVSTIRVDDGSWHMINFTREGSVAWLIVDKDKSSGSSPGVQDTLNLDSEFTYIGAKVDQHIEPGTALQLRTSFGFVGCMDQITIDDRELPVAIVSSSDGSPVLKRLANVELQCSSELLVPGACGSYPCFNGGICAENPISLYKCTCPLRYTGSQCQVDTAPCSSSPCLNDGKCIVVGHNYKCQCPASLSGPRCEYGVHCNPNPCQNGGRCEEGQYGPICKCYHFSGSACEEDIDECQHHNPCQNGGTCLNFYGGFKCLCTSNVTGDYCTESLVYNLPNTPISISFENVVILIILFLVILIAIVTLISWQRLRWKKKHHVQNNTIKMQEMHVKNDLKNIDVPRNSKICNVEADQAPPIPVRPISYTPSTDSQILLTLKQLADMSTEENDTIDSAAYKRKKLRSEEFRKPWDHHNNLNEDSSTPVKDVGCTLPANLDMEANIAPGALGASDFSSGSQWDNCDPCNSQSDHWMSSDEAINNKAKANTFTSEPEVDASVVTPLLSSETQVNRSPAAAHYEADDEGEEDEPSFEEILVANNIMCIPRDNTIPNYNIISDIDDDGGAYEPMKLSNNGHSDVNKNLGSPRNRRPFNRSDYNRVSDVSFLSVANDDNIDNSMSDIKDFDKDCVQIKVYSPGKSQRDPKDVIL